MTNLSSLEIEIARNLDSVNTRISKAAKSAGRKPEDILLVVVSKKQPVRVVRAAMNVGIRNFGENYPEQAVDKIAAFIHDPDIRWHMIGHLQSRKIRIVAQKFHSMQSLDSLDLAVKLNESLRQEKKILPVLLQFNVGGEPNKHGWEASKEERWEDLLPDVAEILKLPFLDVHGLMTMPPLEIEIENARMHFRKLYRLKEFLQNNFPQKSWSSLSMGTSVDFDVAIQESATIIRVGQAILGTRI